MAKQSKRERARTRTERKTARDTTPLTPLNPDIPLTPDEDAEEEVTTPTTPPELPDTPEEDVTPIEEPSLEERIREVAETLLDAITAVAKFKALFEVILKLAGMMNLASAHLPKRPNIQTSANDAEVALNWMKTVAEELLEKDKRVVATLEANKHKPDHEIRRA